MNLDWQKIKTEVSKLRNVESVKAELNKIAHDLKKVDIRAQLGPQAKQKIADIEKRYERFLVTFSTAQKQFDREFNKVVRQLKITRSEAQTRFSQTKKEVLKAGANLDRIAKNLKASLTKKTPKRASSSPKARRTSNKKTASK